jgi:hypothetical protein
VFVQFAAHRQAASLLARAGTALIFRTQSVDSLLTTGIFF